jgi:hypothetical protein
MVLGILPPAVTGFGYHWASIYNPPIYEHLEPFLIIPAIVAIFASWSVMLNPASMRTVFKITLPLAILVLFVYLAFPENYAVGSIKIHSINWILSYCVVAMAIALLFGFLLALKRP